MHIMCEWRGQIPYNLVSSLRILGHSALSTCVENDTTEEDGALSLLAKICHSNNDKGDYQAKFEVKQTINLTRNEHFG